MGYLRFPTISGDTVIFGCEDDLWSVPADGGRAWRLTAGIAETTSPYLSPDGTRVAFLGGDEGPLDVYVMAAEGGDPRRLTFDGVGADSIAGWTQGGSPGSEQIIYASSVGRPFTRDVWLHQVAATGGAPAPLPYGQASSLSYGPDGGLVLGRGARDPAHWKRYRGGRAGTLWVDGNGTGEFRPLLRLAGNLVSPCWVGDRIFFLSDHQGVGNVYSCTPDGQDLRRHTDHEDFYARNLQSDGSRLVYHCAGDLWLLDPDAGGARRLDVRLGSSRSQRNRQFVAASQYLDSASLGPDGSDLAITTRGKAFSLAHWEGPVRQHGELDGVRYRSLAWLDDHERLIAVQGDETPEERLVVLTADGSAPPRVLDLDVGRVLRLQVAPHVPADSGITDHIALTNHRCELLVVSLPAEGEPTLRRIDHSAYEAIGDPVWSPDGRWLAYSRNGSAQTRAITLCRVETGETWPITRPVLTDWSPAFDPDGKYLYFLGDRDFRPMRDQLHFELGFPLGSRPYLVTLRADVASPFVPEARPVVSQAAAQQAKVEEERKEVADKGAEQPSVEPVEIDLDGILERVIAFPVPEGRYSQIAGVRGKVLFSRSPLSDPDEAKHVLEVYDFETQKKDTLIDDIGSFTLDRGCHTLLYRSGDRLRVLKAGEKPSDDSGDAKRASGWIDLDRVKVSVRPGAEWRQMFREAWRLQRQYFWVEDMSGVQWDDVYDAYLPLVDEVASRSELSDLLWELQGELGTSHAYELGGAYRSTPHYRQGFLGIDWTYDEASGHFRVGKIVHGDPWDADATSPALRPGADIAVGDVVLAVNGQPIGRIDGGAVRLPGEPLVNQGGQEVQLTVRRGDGEARTVAVRAADGEYAARYRDWVETNRAYVAEQTGGRIGYVHIPDMGAWGFGEFHRSFLTEYDRDGLVVDVRYNGGGNVSSLLLEKLARRRIGYAHSRWASPEPYPYQSPRGPMVALTNAFAGSDGDIFSHAFKMMGLGPLVGTRTWGGVIGIANRGQLADGTMTTQPEYSFAFDDVGWQVENYGTDPDIEVDIAPHDYVKGIDPQLDKAIEVALAQLSARPPHSPNPTDRPRLARPQLPPRAH